MFSLARHILSSTVRRPATRPYPFAKRAAIPGSRGSLENDIAGCVFCGLCVRRCPTAALTVTKAPKRWTLDPYRCILCGLCVEGCPKKCLSFSPVHRPPSPLPAGT